MDGRFPTGKGEVPVEAIGYLAQQTKTVPSMWADYDWQGRTIKYHRSEIRLLFDFREATTEDSESVMAWLRAHVLTQERDPERVTEAALLRFRDLKLEPPTAERLDHLIRSTLRTFEEDFCSRVSERSQANGRRSEVCTVDKSNLCMEQEAYSDVSRLINMKKHAERAALLK